MSNTGGPISKTQYVLDRLRAEILAGEIDAGKPIKQTEIAQRYGVSPTPVREAMRLLEADGSIQYSPHRGATIRDISPAEALDLYLLRAEVEGLATRLATERATDADLAEFRGINDDLHAAGDDVDRALLNRQFHFAIFRVGSELVAGHAASLWAKFPRAVTLWREEVSAARLLDDHDRMLEAMEAGDSARADRLAMEHVLHAKALRSTPSG